MKPPLLLTPGEPGGVGLEITLRAWSALRSESGMAFAVLADAPWLRHISSATGLSVPVTTITDLQQAGEAFATSLPVLHRALPAPAQIGLAQPVHASWVINCIKEAVDLCLAGSAAAMVTNPIQKETLYAAGFTHQGHTDFLAHLARQKGHAAQDVMMLVGGGLRAVPITVHIPLKDIPRELTADAIIAQARTVAQDLTRFFGIKQPRLAVTGLNPHAGENGSMGREEIDTIIPAINLLKREGLSIQGPLPADTAFFPEMRETYDAVLCMYHDQALIPVKALDFHGGVNATLGLPFIRTSPDHGTALALAGTGKAKSGSLVAAIKLAADMAAMARNSRD